MPSGLRNGTNARALVPILQVSLSSSRSLATCVGGAIGLVFSLDLEGTVCRILFCPRPQERFCSFGSMSLLAVTCSTTASRTQLVFVFSGNVTATTMYHHMPGLHPLQPRDDKVPKLRSSGNHCEECTYLPLWREPEIEVVRVVDLWSTEYGHHVIDGADIHDHPPLLVPWYRREGRLCGK